MRFRSRLLVGFLIMMLLPIVLIVLLGVILYHYQRNSFETAYNAVMNREEMSASVAANLCESTAIRVQKNMQKDASSFTEPDQWSNNNLYLIRQYNSFLVRIDGDGMGYKGDFHVSSDFVKEIQNLPVSEAVQYYAPDNVFFRDIIMEPEVQKAVGRLVLATHADSARMEFNDFVRFFVACAVLIMFLTALLITMGISRSIIQPIREVQKASRQVRDGNLDYELNIKDHEFRPLCDDFNQMRMRLKESERIKAQADADNQELISNISHDLKTPLTAVKGYVEGLLDNIADTPERREKYLTTIYNKTIDMQRLIDELTFYSRVDTNRIPYHFVPLPIADFFRDCADETELDLTSRGMKLEFSCEIEDDVLVMADPEQMRRVLNNIIGNSVKYMDKPNGAVGIHLWRDEQKVYAELMDNGPGISEEALPYIFDRFYRADAARNQNQAGSGIGLSIVQKVVEDHGGAVYASSTPGEGTKITIELAILKENEDREDEKDIDR